MRHLYYEPAARLLASTYPRSDDDQPFHEGCAAPLGANTYTRDSR
jgi:hypothetical protein